jgi:hypothetical protein
VIETTEKTKKDTQNIMEEAKKVIEKTKIAE